MTDFKFPYYRLLNHSNRYQVEIVIGESQKDPNDDWTRTVDTKQIADTITKESALAALRLHGAKEYHDWSSKNAHWDMPLTKL